MPPRSFVCIVYTSTAKAEVISQLLRVARATRGVCNAHHFVDSAYNRTSVYLVSRHPSLLCSTALQVCREAFQLIDYSKHTGTHPALGAVDHICFSPLEPDASADEQREIGLEFGSLLNKQEQVDVHLYGNAAATTTNLKSIRRSLGYFGAGGSDGAVEEPKPPDFAGSPEMFSSKGVSCVGVVPLVINFNIRLTEASSGDKKLASQVTALLRVDGAVEGLTLKWANQLEIACNLRSSLPEHSCDAVLTKAKALAAERGLEIESSYTTGPTARELLETLAAAEEEEE